MRAPAASVIAALAAALTLSACTPLTRVVMLPQPGHRSVVEVTPRAQAPAQQAQAVPGAETVLLTKPYQTATLNTLNRVSVQQSSRDRVQARYRELLAAQPPAAQNYRLYFQPNDTQLTPESASQLDDVIAQAMSRPGNEIIVTGHTDSVGTVQANDQLSLERAQVIRQAIIARGFDPARVYAVGRGSRNPLVPAGDQAAEQKNRRVEIIVR